MILAPVVVKNKNAVRGLEPVKFDELFRLAGFRTTFVFDISQTQGRPLPEFAKTTGDPKEYGDKLKALVGKQGITVEYDSKIAPGLGMSGGGRIWLMPGMSKAEEFSVLAHELAHELIHHVKGTQSLPKVVRETQAEAVAFVACRAAGLDTNNAASDYIALYQGDKKTLAESLSVIQETSAKILNDLLPERLASSHEKPSSQTVSPVRPTVERTRSDVRESNAHEIAPDRQDSIAPER
jgi:hypothetical protein